MAREYVGMSINAADEFCACVDRLRDLPAEHPGPHGIGAHTETWCARYDDGALGIVRIDDSVIAMLGQSATIRNRGGQDVEVTLSLAGAQRALPKDDSWTPREPRGGLEALAGMAKGRVR